MAAWNWTPFMRTNGLEIEHKDLIPKNVDTLIWSWLNMLILLG